MGLFYLGPAKKSINLFKKGKGIHVCIKWARTDSKSGLKVQLKDAFNGLFRKPEVPIPPENCAKETLVHGITRVDPFGKLSLETLTGKKYMKQEKSFFKKASHQKHVSLINIELQKSGEQSRDLLRNRRNGSDSCYLLEIGPRYKIYLSDDSQCYARDYTDESHKIPLFSLEDIGSLFQKTGLDSKGIDLWVISRIQVSNDLQHVVVLLSHPQFEVGPLFFLKRGVEEGKKHAQLGSGMMSVLFFSERAFNFVLGKNSKGESLLLFTVPNAQLRPHSVVLVSHEGSLIRQVYSEPASNNFIDIGLTRSQRLVTINSNSLTTSEIRLFDLNLEEAPPKLFHQAKAGVECFVDHIHDTFMVLSNQTGTFQLHSITENKFQEEWENSATLIDIQCGTITDVEIFSVNSLEFLSDELTKPKDWALIFSTDDQGVYKLHTYHWRSKFLTPVLGLPEICTLKPAGISQDLASNTSWIKISTPIHPSDLYLVDLKCARLQTAFSHTIPNARLPKIQIDRMWTNTKVPITLVSSGRTDRPILMVAYGAYGLSLLPDYRDMYLPLLRRGWDVALVHIRGGSELGPSWYTRNRQDSVDDVLAAADHFNGRTKAILGISAGAVAVAGAVHKNPSAFQAMILRVPFLDVIGSMLNPNAPLTKVEYLEWGNISNDKLAYQTLLSFSPYDTIPLTKIPPAILVSAGAQDQRTDPNVALRYIARWRKSLLGRNITDPELHSRLLIDMNMEMGHHPNDAHQHYTYISQEIAFLLEHCTDS